MLRFTGNRSFVIDEKHRSIDVFVHFVFIQNEQTHLWITTLNELICIKNLLI